jgi:hypothetical protein
VAVVRTGTVAKEVRSLAIDAWLTSAFRGELMEVDAARTNAGGKNLK